MCSLGIKKINSAPVVLDLLVRCLEKVNQNIFSQMVVQKMVDESHGIPIRTKITNSLSHFGPWNKSLNFIVPIKYVIPKSLSRLARTAEWANSTNPSHSHFSTLHFGYSTVPRGPIEHLPAPVLASHYLREYGTMGFHWGDWPLGCG